MCKIEQNNNLVHHHLVQVKLIHIKILWHTHLLHHPIVIHEIILSYHIRTWLACECSCPLCSLGRCPHGQMCNVNHICKCRPLHLTILKFRGFFLPWSPPTNPVLAKNKGLGDHAQIYTCFHNCNLGKCCSACTLLFCIQSCLDPMVVNWNVLYCLLLAFFDINMKFVY